jgi:hypothetical protein
MLFRHRSTFLRDKTNGNSHDYSTDREVVIEHFYKNLQSLGYYPNKNGGQNKQVAKKPISPLHPPPSAKKK